MEEFAESVAKEIATSGKHTLLIGPPLTGKLMIARRITQYMGRLTTEDSRVISQIYRAAGMDFRIIRPFRAPHHTVSRLGMGGRPPDAKTWVPTFGELSLAHGGVLYLDELPEFRRDVLALVSEAIETGTVTHRTRSGYDVVYPARCLVVASMNPCPCGWYGSSRRRCSCTSEAIRQYQAYISAFAQRMQTVELEEAAYGESRDVEEGKG